MLICAIEILNITSSCLLLSEYWNLVPNNTNIRVKQMKIWLLFKTWCSLSVPPKCAVCLRKKTDTLDAWIGSVRRFFLFFRYFEDVTITAGVNMDEAYKSEEGRMNDGTYSFGSSFTVSFHVAVTFSMLENAVVGPGWWEHSLAINDWIRFRYQLDPFGGWISCFYHCAPIGFSSGRLVSLFHRKPTFDCIFFSLLERFLST